MVQLLYISLNNQKYYSFLCKVKFAAQTLFCKDTYKIAILETCITYYYFINFKDSKINYICIGIIWFNLLIYLPFPKLNGLVSMPVYIFAFTMPIDAQNAVSVKKKTFQGSIAWMHIGRVLPPISDLFFYFVLLW